MKPQRSILTVSIMAAAVISIAGSPFAQEAPESAGEEEYDAVSSLIGTYYGDDLGLILIAEKTEPWCVVIHLSELKGKWKGLKNETFDSLIERNRRYYVFENRFTIATEYRLISKEEYIGVLGDSLSPDWDNFDAVYPETSGVFIASRVGMDPEKSQALVYFCNAYRCSDDRIIPKNRSIAFLQKEDDGWKLVGIEKGLRAFSAY